ncbi:hypothetical protein F5Y04DRAFT_276253 [Hypomontagnella monticulosa]|nr:hypothetical protein F5Y04DRAFT_276253 [Hypomontagnella monticulosa]
MCPIGTYQRYKDDLDYVTKWLATTAQAHGYLFEPPTNPLNSLQELGVGRLKGKARKEAKEAARWYDTKTKKQCVIKIRDLIPLAELITSCQPPISVPEAFAASLRRLIKHRGRFSGLLEKTGFNLVNLAHKYPHHLVGILAAVCNILEPRMSFSKIPIGSETPSEGGTVDFIGYFGDLAREEVSDFVNAIDPPRPELPSQGSSAIEFPLEPPKSKENAVFALYHFYRDLQVIQDYAVSVWMGFFTGDAGVRRPLASPALLTILCIGLVQDLEKDITLLCRSHGDVYKVSQELALHLSNRQSMSSDVTEDSYGTDEAMLVPSFNMLRKLCNGLLGKKSNTISHDFDPSKEFPLQDGPPVEEKRETDSHILQWFFVESYLLATKKSGYVVEDEAIKGMRNLAKTTDVPLPLAFAGHVFLDIHRKHGEQVTDAFDVMVQQLLYMHNELEDYKKFQEDSPRGAVDRNKSRRRELNDLMKDIDSVISDAGFDERMKVHKKLGIPVTNRRHDFLRRNPILCGLTLFHFQSRMERLTLATLNASPAPIAATYLHYALADELLIEYIWHDVHMFLEVFGVSSLFTDGDVPHGRDNFNRQLLLRLGWPASVLSSGDEQVDLEATTKQQPVPSKGEILRMYIEKCMPGKAESPNWTRGLIRSMPKLADGRHFKGDGGRDLPSYMPMVDEEIQGRKRAMQGSPTYTLSNIPIWELLHQCSVALQDDHKFFTYPSLTFIRMAHSCLDDVREACEPLLKEHLPGYDCGPEPHRFVLWLFRAVTCGVESAALRNEIFQAAATAMAAFISSEIGDETSHRFQHTTGLKYEFLRPDNIYGCHYSVMPRPSEEELAKMRDWTKRDDLFR